MRQTQKTLQEAFYTRKITVGDNIDMTYKMVKEYDGNYSIYSIEESSTKIGIDRTESLKHENLKPAAAVQLLSFYENKLKQRFFSCQSKQADGEKDFFKLKDSFYKAKAPGKHFWHAKILVPEIKFY